MRGRCHAVAVSNAYTLAPWVYALVSNDAAWWINNPDARKFAGRKFAGATVNDVESCRYA